MTVDALIKALHLEAPLALQEEYDNSGLLIGDPADEVRAALVSLDITPEVLEEAIGKGCNLVLSHHPLIFKGLKTLTLRNETERMVATAIRHNLNIAALHTNLDNIDRGVNRMLCDRLGIVSTRILRPLQGQLRKLVTFCPEAQADHVRKALFSAGAGHIGAYDSCSYNGSGYGTFRAGEGTDPFVGKIGELHREAEERIEVIYPFYNEDRLIRAMTEAHPYEEVAYDIYPLLNIHPGTGAGMIGELEEPEMPAEFLRKVKEVLSAGCIRHTSLPGKKISKVAVCGGSGSFLIRDAMNAGAEIFLTGDIKYHDFFLPEGKMVLADIGHYESEQFTKELIFTLLKKKFPTFALFISETSTNPVKYL